MISNFNSLKTFNKQIKINENFPKDKLVKIFKPYLHLYMKGKYLLIQQLKRDSLYELNKKLIRFQKFNPLFGRFKYLFEKRVGKNGIVRAFRIGEEYNIKHIRFEDETNNEKFLKDHLAYKYNNYIHTQLYYIINNIENENEDEEEDEDQDQEDQYQDDLDEDQDQDDLDEDQDQDDLDEDQDIIFQENSDSDSLS